MAKESKYALVRSIIKAFNQSVEAQESYSLEELQEQREKQEKLAILAVFDVRTMCIPFNVGDMECCKIVPDLFRRKKKVILYCHGGGYTCGRLSYARILGSRLARRFHMDVVAFAYRLSPENKYPAAIEDAMKMWDWLLANGYDESQIYLMGDSAGGNLALELCLRLKRENRKMPRAMVLYSPWTDMTASSKSYVEWEESDPIVSRQYVLNARKAYVGEGVEDFDNPEYSPLFADLRGLPPTLVQVGGAEVLRNDSEELVERMRHAGVKSVLQVFRGGWHVFQQAPGLLTNIAFIKAKIFLQMMDE